MPTWNKQKRKWVAKRKRNGVSYHLGYFKYKNDATYVEWQFDYAHPRVPPFNRWEQ